jgi:hypothetical protein
MPDIVNELIAGDTLDFTVSVADYPASDGWVLVYALRGPSVINLTASAVGDDHHIQADSATSSAWLPGDYTWVSTVSKAGQRYTVDSSRLKILPDLTQAVAGYDGRSVAEIALADAESALATFRSTKGRTKKYTIGSRSMEFDSAADILLEINFWKIKVGNERAANSIAQGLGNPRRMQVRFR